MSCFSQVAGCGFALTVLNDYAIEVDATPSEAIDVGDFWLYDAFNPTDRLSDPTLVDATKYAWDSPQADVLVGCAAEACRTNFELAGGACFVTADYDLVDVNNG